MKKNKVTKFFVLGALMIFVVYFGGEQTDTKVMVAGIVFAAAAVVSWLIGNIINRYSK